MDHLNGCGDCEDVQHSSAGVIGDFDDVDVNSNYDVDNGFGRSSDDNK